MSVASWCFTCFCVVLCVGFFMDHFVMVPLNLTYLHCLQHSSLNISSIYITINHFKFAKPSFREFLKILVFFSVHKTIKLKQHGLDL